MIAAALLTALLSQATPYYSAEEAQALFAQANDAYYRQPPDYPAAKAAYLKLLEHHQGGVDVLFNLGTTCLAASELGEAVLYLERAKALQRRDDIEANLSIARERQADQVVGADNSETFLQRLSQATNERLLSIATLVTLWLGFLLLGALLWLPAGRRLWPALLGAFSLGIAGVCGGLVAVHAYVADSVKEAVVMAPTASVRDYPGESGRVAFEVHAGLKVRLVDDSGKFVRIRLPNNVEGWVEKSGVAEL